MRSRLSPEPLLDMAYAYRGSRILLTAFELGVFTAVGRQGATSARIGRAVRADPRAVDRLMNSLAALGLLRKSGDVFRNSPLAAAFLVEGAPGYLAGLGHTAGQWRRWGTLTESVRKGTAADPVPLRKRGRRWREAFIAAMHWRGMKQAAAAAAAVGLRGVSRLLDVGGGSGAFSIVFCRLRPGLTAVVLDLPEVLPLARGYIRRAGLSDRIRAVAADYEKDPLGSGYDLVFLSAVLHSNSPAVNLALLRKAHAALRPGGRVAVSDFLLDETRTKPAEGALFALNMLVSTQAGDSYTEAEVRGWLEASGFTAVRRAEGGGQTAILLGTKPPAAPGRRR